MNGDDTYAWAWEHADRNPDGTVVEESLVALVAERIDFDADKERRGKAQRIIAYRKRPGQTAPAGAVALPGMDLYPYEPHRLLADDAGNVVENQHAGPKVKQAEAGRSAEAARKALARRARDRVEADLISEWAEAELAKGRDPRELTWDACLRESGAWKDADPEPDAAGDDDDPGEVAS